MFNDGIDMPLPPHWREIRYGDDVHYVNEISGEETLQHPYHKFLELFAGAGTSRGVSKAQTPMTEGEPKRWDEYVARGENIPEGENEEVSLSGSSVKEEKWHVPASSSSQPQPPQPWHEDYERERKELISEERKHTSFQGNDSATNEDFGMRTNQHFPELANNSVYYDYHCQWNERDVFGNVSLFGLTIRYLENGTTMIRFDGIEGEWTYSALKGPYGCLEMHDLYVGAKINLFGRHLTISACNSAATKWIGKERKRLEKQQAEFRRKIESIGAIPCVKKKEANTVRNITRDEKTVAQCNIRLLLRENARLGEQLANLGLTTRL